MDKLSFLKPGLRVRARNYLKYSNNTRQHEYKDTFLSPGSKLPFAHSWALMGHMHDLRLWTLAYAPSDKNNLQRLQELHRLNCEMWYNYGQSLYKRIIVGVFLYFFVTKIARRKYMNQGNKDT